MNIGVRPSFHKQEPAAHYEVHILDFDQTIVKETIDVDVCFFIREEIGFSSIDELIAQICTDIDDAKKRFQLLESHAELTPRINGVYLQHT
jgi:FAD synthase